MTEALGPSAVYERAAAHSRPVQLVIGIAALVVGRYAAWLGGDYGLGWGSIVGFGLVTAYLLVQQPSARAVVARSLSLLAGLVLVTPVFLHLPVLTGAPSGVTSSVGLVFHPGVYVLSLVFVGLAAVLAAVGLLVDER